MNKQLKSKEIKKLSVHERLVYIQKNLKAPKSQFNKFGNYNYRNCEDILEAVKSLLGDCSLIIEDRVVKKGDRYYIKAIAYLSDGKDVLKASAYARETDNKKGMDASQITGAASSYARKYALNGLFAIDDTKDSDTTSEDKEQEKAIDDWQPSTKAIEDKKASEDQIKMIFAIAKEAGYESEKTKEIVKTNFNLDSFNDLTVSQAKIAIDAFLKKSKKG